MPLYPAIKLMDTVITDDGSAFLKLETVDGEPKADDDAFVFDGNGGTVDGRTGGGNFLLGDGSVRFQNGSNDTIWIDTGAPPADSGYLNPLSFQIISAGNGEAEHDTSYQGWAHFEHNAGLPADQTDGYVLTAIQHDLPAVQKGTWIMDATFPGETTVAPEVVENAAFESYDWPGEYAQRFDGIDKGGAETVAFYAQIDLYF